MYWARVLVSANFSRVRPLARFSRSLEHRAATSSDPPSPATTSKMAASVRERQTGLSEGVFRLPYSLFSALHREVNVLRRFCSEHRAEVVE